MKRHEADRAGSVGNRDSWGFGSSSSSYGWPSLGMKDRLVTNTTGGTIYPIEIGVCKNADGNLAKPPLTGWSTDRDLYHECRRYFVADNGRAFVLSDGYQIVEFASEQDALDYLNVGEPEA